MSEYFCYNQNHKKVTNITFLSKTGPGMLSHPNNQFPQVFKLSLTESK